MLATSALVGAAAFIITIALFTLFPSSKRDCFILVTGESARVVNCEITAELAEVIKNLKPYAHGLG
ncbi:triple gene block protein 3 [Cherry virus Turkey]|nr:triple gene block protein 3 [Cherry virus Turkey]QCO31671.1 triple gene block protein 3 [Cherry virus Turkey]